METSDDSEAIARDCAILVRVECLDDLADPVTTGAFPTLPSTASKASSCTVPRVGSARWRERQVQRAIAAARKARLQNYRVEIAPDGTVTIVVGAKR